MSFCRLAGVATAVPQQCIRNDHFHALLGGPGPADRLFATLGIQERRWAPEGTTALDLCVAAGKALLNEAPFDPSTIDAVLMVTQTGDFALPASACLAQDRLGLGTHTLAFDINQGCTGFVYGLGVAKSLVVAGMARRVLLLAGDTSSHCCDPLDKATLPLFGDSGTASILEAAPQPGIHAFSFGTDGSGWNVLAHPVGRLRYPTMESFTARASEAEKAAFPYPCSTNMDGSRVFSFCLEQVPQLVRKTLELNSVGPQDLDFTIFHQANLMMMEVVRRKAGLAKDTFLTSLARFGNTSVASIPVTMTDQRARLQSGGRTLMVGFGVGLSLAGTVVDLDADLILPPLVEV